MIKKIQIKNYQTHSKFQLKLDPHITTIVGPSDVGKSAVIRALRWVCLNRPLGDHYIKDGTESCAVRVLVDDKEVVRKKGKSNIYALEGTKYKAFGNSVPSPVKDVLNIGNINFQGQHDSSFWFSLSAGDVARQLNEIIDLDIIDKSMGYIAKDLRRKKTLVEVTETKVKQTEEKLDELGFVEELTDDFDCIYTIREKLDSVTNEIFKLENIIRKIKQLEETRGISEELVKNFWSIEELAIINIETEDKHRKVQSIINEIKKLEKIISKKVPNIVKLNTIHIELLNMEKETTCLQVIMNTIISHAKKIHSYKNEMKELVEQIVELTNGICPICGNELGEI